MQFDRLDEAAAGKLTGGGAAGGQGRPRRTPRGLSPYRLDFTNLALDSPESSEG